MIFFFLNCMFFYSDKCIQVFFIFWMDAACKTVINERNLYMGEYVLASFLNAFVSIRIWISISVEICK